MKVMATRGIRNREYRGRGKVGESPNTLVSPCPNQRRRVCHTGARGVVLCLLEVGRLAQGWWGLEPPGIIKLEREMDGEEWSGRCGFELASPGLPDGHHTHHMDTTPLWSDSGYSNTSSPRGSTLTLHPAAPSPPAADHHSKLPRPLSAPGHLPLVPRLVLPNTSTHTQTEGTPAPSHTPKSTTPRPAKPIPPPKPASIRRAVSNLARRPTSIPTKSRGWSGAKTTPTTPVTTPTHTSKPRLPSARTPRSSGRSTPNTTPTTPTHCRRYISSLQQRTPAPTPPRPVSSRPTSKPPSRSPSICSRLQECYNTVQTETCSEAHRTDLDNKVLDIANQTRGFCGCKAVDCQKSHVKRVSDGKYDICGRNVYVRLDKASSHKTDRKTYKRTSKRNLLSPCDSHLLKGKHVMVRVGGGWDTLEHYLLRHDPKQVTVFNLKSAEPFLHIRAKYCSPTNSGASSHRGSPTHSRTSASRGPTSSGNSSSEGTPPPSHEPQVPISPPAVSSMPTTTEDVDAAAAAAASEVPPRDYVVAKGEWREASFISFSANGTDGGESCISAGDDIADSVTSQPNSEDNSSPTQFMRPIVNSSTFCIEDHNCNPGQSMILHDGSDSNSSGSASTSPKITPPASPSTFSTPACLSSLNTYGSSTTLGTPIPPDDDL
ncbi:hypothetical protein Pmani_037481 [Petrolisthes manimaculis]|uniref:GAR domain-containing protein n=1 Tax=Petrolisthes manimaculis TaxID=1843537 RepID=A0AAE1NGP7_9EUCA|nr:hypothetical protein Pmani_037481 [Petrolisthes manimaculis]